MTRVRSMPPCIVVGFDIGTNFGWAILDADDATRVSSGTWMCPPKPHPASRCIKLGEELAGLMATLRGRQGVVAIEEVRRHTNTRTAHVWGALHSQVEIAAFRAGLEIIALAPSEWMREFVGFGRKPKGSAKGFTMASAYTARANEVFGLDLDEKPNEDEAAALGIAWAAMSLGRVEAA